MPDWLRRALRTLFQVSVVEAIVLLLLAFGVPISPTQHTAILAAATPLVTAVQNALEDHVSAFPAILKAPASDGSSPVPPAGTTT